MTNVAGRVVDRVMISHPKLQIRVPQPIHRGSVFVRRNAQPKNAIDALTKVT